MRHFDYRESVLTAEDVPLTRIAQEVGTPVYVYATATLERHFRVLDDALAGALGATPRLIAYAVKANSNLGVIATLARLGAGADVVSQGELERALRAGTPADRIVFSGVGKTEEELGAALRAGICQINVESDRELRLLDRLACAMGRRQAIVFRVNPDVAAGGHAKISTGKKENKFGVSLAEAEALYAEAAGMAGVEPVGLAVHIGSQIVDFAPLEQAYVTLAGSVARLRARGLSVSRLDLGGGLGAPYERSAAAPDLDAYAAMVARVVGGLNVALTFEPGRLIAGNAGLLLARVIDVKASGARSFLVLDAGMNDLMRPALYDAWHDLIPVIEPRADAALAPMDVVGPICETGDTFAVQRDLPPLAPGDLVAIMTAGAYGSAMSSLYNTRPLTPEVMVCGARYAVVRARPSIDDILRLESAPDWLAACP
jgi:diaminopimelate decarboxylase